MKKLSFEILTVGSTMLLSGCRSASLGIIGGADGPTAVFISSSGPNYLLPALTVGVLLLAVILWAIHKRK